MGLNFNGLNDAQFLDALALKSSVMLPLVGINLSSTGVQIVRKDNGQTRKVPATLSNFIALKSGSISSTMRAKMRGAVIQEVQELFSGEASVAVKNMLADMAAPGEDDDEQPVFAEAKKAKAKVPMDTPVKKLKTADVAKAPAVDVPAEVNEALSFTPVLLAKATTQYQPVKGTSANSVYHAVAILEGVNIGVRWKGPGSSLSVRFEGPKIEALLPSIEKIGVSLGGHKNYASMHVAVSDRVAGDKVLGAVVSGLVSQGIELKSAMPRLAYIEGKGC